MNSSLRETENVGESGELRDNEVGQFKKKGTDKSTSLRQKKKTKKRVNLTQTEDIRKIKGVMR